jgi:transposase-like protein
MNEKSPFGRRYDREFKENAVALVRDGKRVTAVARDLGVSAWALGRSRAGRQWWPGTA